MWSKRKRRWLLLVIMKSSMSEAFEGRVAHNAEEPVDARYHATCRALEQAGGGPLLTQLGDLYTAYIESDADTEQAARDALEGKLVYAESLLALNTEEYFPQM